MHNETKKSNERSGKKSVGEPVNLIQIEHLIDLEPHTDDIIDRFNADKPDFIAPITGDTMRRAVGITKPSRYGRALNEAVQ